MLLKRLEPGDVLVVTRLDRLGAQLRACSSHGRARLTPRPPPRNDPHPAKLAAPVLIPGAEYRVISLSAELPPTAQASQPLGSQQQCFRHNRFMGRFRSGVAILLGNRW